MGKHAKENKSDKYLADIAGINELLLENKHIPLDSRQADPRRLALFSMLERRIRKNANVTHAVVNYFEVTNKISFLIYFAQENCHEMVDLLFQLRAPVNTPEQENAHVSALLRASEHADTKMVEKLLNKGANPRVFNELGFASIHLAIGRNLSDMVEVLLRRDKELIDLKTRGGISPLCAAILNTTLETLENSEKMIAFLLESGADISAEFRPSTASLNIPWNALYAAIQQGFPSIIRLIHKAIQKKMPQFVANRDLIIGIMRTSHASSAEKLENIKTLLSELGYLPTDIVIESDNLAIDSIISRVLSREIKTFSSLWAALENNPQAFAYLVISNDKNILNELITTVRARINESMTIDELWPLTRIIKFYFLASTNTGPNVLRALKVTYISVIRSIHTQARVESFETISFRKVIEYIKTLKYSQKLCHEVGDIETKNLLSFRMLFFLNIGHELLPEYVTQWLDDYLDNNNNPYLSFPEYQTSVALLLTNHLKNSADSPAEKSKYVDALVEILRLKNYQNTRFSPSEEILLNFAQGICLIMKSIISKETFHIGRADKFCNDHKELQFSILNEWTEFQALVTKMHEKPLKEKQPMRSQAALPSTTNNNAGLSQQSETILMHLMPTEANVTTVITTAPAPSRSPKTQSDIIQIAAQEAKPFVPSSNSDGDPGSSSGKSTSLNYNLSTLPSYKTEKPQRRKEQAAVVNNAPLTDKEIITNLFGIPEAMQENIVCIDKKRNRWGFFELGVKDFSDSVSHAHFSDEFKKGDPHFVKSRNLEQWVVTLAPGGMDERVFATEEVEKDTTGRSWRLLRFNRVGDHNDYNRPYGNLHYRKS